LEKIKKNNESTEKVWYDEINPRTKKPYKISPEIRNTLREKALIREQDKRIKKTAEESKKRKARKTKSSV
jgi:hypothetical protein